MRVRNLFVAAFTAICAAASTPSTQGIRDLVQRRLPQHVKSFEFELVDVKTLDGQLDEYTISSLANAKTLVQGNSLSALASG